jgi:hypothetical protein
MTYSQGGKCWTDASHFRAWNDQYETSVFTNSSSARSARSRRRGLDGTNHAARPRYSPGVWLPEAERIDAPGARAWLYRLPAGRFRGFGAITIGHVIIIEPKFLELHGLRLLAHELSHARQHDWLGPTYLPLHAFLQAISVLLYFIRPIAKFSAWHAYNPLERALLCVQIDVIVDERPPEGELASKVLHAFELICRQNDLRGNGRKVQ